MMYAMNYATNKLYFPKIGFSFITRWHSFPETLSFHLWYDWEISQPRFGWRKTEGKLSCFLWIPSSNTHVKLQNISIKHLTKRK